MPVCMNLNLRVTYLFFIPLMEGKILLSGRKQGKYF